VNENERTVLITGASGFVGRPSLAALMARGFRVHAASRLIASEIPAGVVWHKADLLDSAQRRTLIEKVRPSHLLHLAWDVEHGRFWTAPDNAEWTAASLDLLKLFAEQGGRRAVFTGTCAEYDWSKGATAPWREDRACRPATPYGQAKLELAEKGAGFAARTGVSFAWARFFLMFGFGEDRRRLIPSIIRGLLAEQDVPLSSGRQIRDFMDTRDVAEALAALISTEGVTGPVNVASGRALSLRDVGQMLVGGVGRGEHLLKFGALPDREGEPQSMVADISCLTHETGFTPQHTLEERLHQCVDWHRIEMRRA
jgi:nucleoside-diphosphate-sugar epimerase